MNAVINGLKVPIYTFQISVDGVVDIAIIDKDTIKPLFERYKEEEIETIVLADWDREMLKIHPKESARVVIEMNRKAELSLRITVKGEIEWIDHEN